MSVERVKEKILKESLKLFAYKGYGGVTVGEIAKACNMKTPNLYKYYESKEAIYESIKNRAYDSYKRSMKMGSDSMIWIHNGEELKEFSLYQIRYTMQDEIISNIRKLCIIEQFRDSFLCEKLSEKQYRDLNVLYKGIFEGLMKKGVIKEQDADLLALEYIAPITLIIQEGDRYPEKFEELINKSEKYIDYFIEKTFISQ